ncbi:MAG: carbohydrate ABC transporter permease [Propionibacteriaceae bacterium]
MRTRRLFFLIGRTAGRIGLVLIALAFSFPILYMVFSSFRDERAIAPPSLTFEPTLDNYRAVLNDELLLHLNNSIVITLTTVALTVLIGLPMAYAIAYGRLRRPMFQYNWTVTTMLLPAVAVIMPLYVIFSRIGILDSRLVMVLLYTALGIPLMVWMATTYLVDIPQSIREAAQLDGCTRWQEFWHVLLPIIRGGVTSTALLVFVVTWNEFLFAIAFTFTESGTLPVFMNRYMTQQGLFWGKMSAVASIAILIPVVFGFLAQKSLIKGLLSGAVKE